MKTSKLDFVLSGSIWNFRQPEQSKSATSSKQAARKECSGGGAVDCDSEFSDNVDAD